MIDHWAFRQYDGSGKEKRWLKRRVLALLASLTRADREWVRFIHEHVSPYGKPKSELLPAMMKEKGWSDPIRRPMPASEPLGSELREGR